MSQVAEIEKAPEQEPYTKSWQLFFQRGDQVMALPCWEKPRLYVVSDNWKQRWDDSAFYPAFKFHAKGFKLLLRILATCRCLPSRKMSSDTALIQSSVRPGIRMAVLVGTRSPTQKLIAKVVDKKSAQTVSYIKYAETAVAKEKTDTEHQVLTALHARKMDAPIQIAPKVCNYGALGDGMALEVSAIHGTMLPSEVPDNGTGFGKTQLYKLIEKIPTSTDSYELHEHPAIKQLIALSGTRFDVESCLAPLRKKQWPVVIQHGDFTPWNILKCKDGSYIAVDWEEGVLEGFPYFDLIYFVLQTGFLINKWSPEKCLQHLHQLLTNEKLSTAEVTSLTGLCALDAYFRFGAEQGNPRSQEFRKRIFAIATQTKNNAFQ